MEAEVVTVPDGVRLWFATRQGEESRVTVRRRRPGESARHLQAGCGERRSVSPNGKPSGRVADVGGLSAHARRMPKRVCPDPGIARHDVLRSGGLLKRDRAPFAGYDAGPAIIAPGGMVFGGENVESG